MYHCLNWHTFKLFLASLVAFIALDSLWIGYLMKDMYKDKISFSDLQEMGFFSSTALLTLLVWALIAYGIVIFVLPRTHGNYLWALCKGGLYGLILYGSYEITNYLVIPNWPMEMVRYDIAWGVTICALVTAITVYVAHFCGCEGMLQGCGKGRKEACQ